MKYTKEMIENVIESHADFMQHLENVLLTAGIRDDINRVETVYGDKLSVQTTSQNRCGDTEYENHQIPYEWLAADPEELQRQIEEKRERDREESRRIYEAQQKVEQARREASEREQLAKLKAKYETQGVTP